MTGSSAADLLDQYAAAGMKPTQDYEIVMVFRGDGAQFLLTDEAYDQKVAQPHGKGNPSRPMIEALSKGEAISWEDYKPTQILENWLTGEP